MNKAKLRRIGRAFANGLGMRFFHPKRIDLGVEQVQIQEQIAPPPLAYIEPEIRNKQVRAFLASFLSEESCDLWCFQKSAEDKPYRLVAQELKEEIQTFVEKRELTARTAETRWLQK